MSVRLFGWYYHSQSNKMSRLAHKSITDFFAKRVPQQESTASIVKTNINQPSSINEYSCLSHQIEYKHSHRDSQVSVFDIQFYDNQNQKPLSNEKNQMFSKYINNCKHHWQRAFLNTINLDYFPVTDKLQYYITTAGI